MIAFVIAFILLLLLLIQLPPIQNFAASKVMTSLNRQMEVTISAEHMSVPFFNKVKVRGLVIAGQNMDTVISAREIRVGLKIIPLIRNDIRLGRIRLDDPGLHLVINERDSLLNIATMFRPEGAKKKDDVKGSLPNVRLDQLRISNLDLVLADRVKKSTIALKLGDLLIRPDQLDLEKQLVEVSKLNIHDLYLDIRQPAGDTTLEATASDENRQEVDLLKLFPWSIYVEQLEMQNNNIDIREPGSDPQEQNQVLLIQKLDTELSGIALDQEGYAIGISSLQGILNRDLVISDARMNLNLNNRTAAVSDGMLQMNDSRLFLDAEFNYASASGLISDPGTTELQVHLNAASGIEELARILHQEWPITGPAPVLLEGAISGKLDSIVIDSIRGNAGEAVRFNFSGTLNSFRDIDQLSGTINMEEFIVKRNELFALYSDTLLPGDFTLPEEVSLKGTVKGDRLSITSDLAVLTSMGSVYARANAVMDTAQLHEQMEIRIDSGAFDLGAFLNKPDTLGRIGFDGQLHTLTKALRDPEIKAELNIASVEYLGYSYSDLTFTADYDDEAIYLQSSMTDPNSSFLLRGEVHFNDSVPDIFLEADVHKLRLEPLHFSTSRADLEMKVRAGLSGLDPKYMLGDLQLSDLYYQTEFDRYSIDSLRLNLDGRSGYRLSLDNLRVSDTLYVHDIKIQTTLQDETAEIGYSGKFEHIPGTTRSLIDLEGDGRVHLLSDSILLGSTFQFSNRKDRDTSIYRIDFSRIRADQSQSSYDLSLAGDDLFLEGEAAIQSPGNSQIIHGRARVDSLNLSLLHPFLSKALHTLSGSISADLEVNGSVSSPDLKGSVTFRNTRFNPRALNTQFTLQEETVSLQNRQISFNQLTLRDNLDNKASLDGIIDLGRDAGNNFDLSLKASEFHLVNKSSAEGGLYYGNVFADLEGAVSGTFENPVIQLQSAFRKESEFSFVLPASRTKTGDGVIQFVNVSESEEMPDDTVTVLDTIRTSPTNLELSANTTLTDRFTLTIITNPLTGERLRINGNGDLGFSLDRSGAMGLNGKYEISEGSYNLLLFDLIRRNFIIDPGSYISWSGEILEATADITAIYKVTSSLDDLMQYRQGPSAMAGDYGSGDFEVIMRLTGPLLTPEIEFDIRSDQQGSAISDALSTLRNNESELNKQVFSLLVFNSFLGEAAAYSDAQSYEFRNESRQSLSGLLSKQLDRFADQYIKQVDLDIEIDSYETGMEEDVSARTDVKMDLSTGVFNDRLTLEVGGSVAVEESGNSSREIGAGDLAGEFRVEYKLSKDGVYRVNVFNKTDYENEMDGEVTKTGVSFIFNKDFTSFRDLFGGKKEGGQDED